MSGPLRVWVCERCASAHFPARLRCPRCGADAGALVAAAEGVVEQATVVHRAVGAPGRPPHRLATVALDAGPRVVAALEEELAAGTRVALELRGGAPHARRAGPPRPAAAGSPPRAGRGPRRSR